jgi:signal transduction histidine kinase
MPTDLLLELHGAEKLITVIQELSLARDLQAVMTIVRHAARQLTGADGATFVLRDGTYCYYAEEDAISPLWKGNRFPLSHCISGWVMMNRQPVVIPDIYQDPRIPVDAYRPTFVKSLAMVPIRLQAPIAAIGNYWATHHETTERELKLLQALANSTSVAMENIELLTDLERRVRMRTQELAHANRELEEKNRELEAFALSASHDLRAPLRAIKGFADMLTRDSGNQLTPQSCGYLEKIDTAGRRMNALIDDLLSLARVSTATVRKTEVNLSAVADDVLQTLASSDATRTVHTLVSPNAVIRGDPGLLRIVLENLLGNAWKFTAKRADAFVEFGFSDHDGVREFFVRDNGAGFPPDKTGKLFNPFQRLHPESEFPGTGIGLATVRRIVMKHGGEVRAEGSTGAGAIFTFALPRE